MLLESVSEMTLPSSSSMNVDAISFSPVAMMDFFLKKNSFDYEFATSQLSTLLTGHAPKRCDLLLLVAGLGATHASRMGRFINVR